LGAQRVNGYSFIGNKLPKDLRQFSHPAISPADVASPQLTLPSAAFHSRLKTELNMNKYSVGGNTTIGFLIEKLDLSEIEQSWHCNLYKIHSRFNKVKRALQFEECQNSKQIFQIEQ